MVVVCLIAVFAVSAVGAGSALANDKYNVNTYQQFKHCPFKAPGITDCFTGITNGGPLGGYFQYGTVLTKLTKSIAIQGGYKGEGTEIEVIAPEDGAKLLESPPEPIVKGLKVITKKIQEEAEWPEALKASFNEAVKNKETKATATIEMAGDECTTVPGCINTFSILVEAESPPAFRLPLKVTVTNPWLEKLGGPCMIGSDEHPIKQNLITGGAGASGTGVHFNNEFTQLFFENTRLVDTGWHISKEQGANGCTGGGEYETYLNKALNLALEVEGKTGNEVGNRTGVTVLTGNLHDSQAEEAQKKLEEGSK